MTITAWFDFATLLACRSVLLFDAQSEPVDTTTVLPLLTDVGTRKTVVGMSVLGGHSSPGRSNGAKPVLRSRNYLFSALAPTLTIISALAPAPATAIPLLPLKTSVEELTIFLVAPALEV